jgi:hypothetical protein
MMRVPALLLGGLLLLSPGVLAGQQRPGGGLPATTRAGAPADTVPADTVAESLTPRERALQRLRALPASPIPPDTAAVADGAADAAGEREPGGEGSEEAQEAGEVGVEEGPGRAADGGPAWPDTADALMEEHTVRSLLRSLDGYVTTEYRGESAVFEGEGNRLRLMGESRVAREGSAMETDSMMVYTGDTGIVCGYGTPVLSGDAADPVESDQVCYDINRRLGMAERARTTFTQGGTWYVRGPENRVFVLNREEGNEVYGQQAQFTSCDLPEPHYVFQARSLKMVENDVMVARNVTLRFEDVPVFWLPWMVQSLKPDRRSGLLTPQFGLNDIVRNSTGYNRRISNLGFYWAVNDYVSALVAGDWFSNNYTSLEGSLTYAWLRQFLQGRLAVRHYWHNAEFGMGGRDLSISTNNSWRPDERTNVQVSGDYTTSTALVRDFSFDPGELNRNIRSSASLNRSFGWGSMSLGATRNQRLTDDQVNWQLPSLNLNLRPLTLYNAGDGGLNVTLSGSGSVNRALRQVNQDLDPRAQGQETIDAGANHTLQFGRLGLSQRVDFRDQTWGARPQWIGETDSIPALAERSDQSLRWSTALSYHQNLWAGTTISPTVSIQGRQIRDERTGGSYLAEPNRISAGASLNTAVYGFWPGFGPYERIRHKISPTLNWSYSPAPSTTPLQDSIFGLQNLREQNRIGLSFNQTFEAKVRDDGRDGNGRSGAQDGGAGGEDGDGEALEGTGDDDGDLDRDDEPRRLPPSRTVNLLSINTSTTFEYDFVRAREESRGFTTEQVSNSIRSDLVPGLQLSMTHHLFEHGETPAGGGLPSRSFSPYLTQLSTSFSMDQNFWLFRMLGLGGQGATDPEPPEVSGTDALEGDLDQRDPGRGAMVPRSGRARGMSAPDAGWRANINYSLNRTRPRVSGGQTIALPAQQTVNGSLGFRPTEHWRVNWATTYSFTTGAFDAHVLTLTRDLHRWQANFDFIKSPNGNFAMQFRVHLLDNPDLKVEYDQRTDPSDRLNMRQP